MNPQTPNQAPFFGRKISKTGINITQATDNQLILKEDYDQGTTIYYDDFGVATVLIGKRPLTGIRGFYVAKPGIDVRTATDDQLIFNSQQDTFKVVLSGNTTISQYILAPSNVEIDTITIPHGLPFIPILDAYVQVPILIGSTHTSLTTVEAYVPLPYDGSIYLNSGSPVVKYTIFGGVDATNIYFVNIYETDGSGSNTFSPVPIRYYLRQETAN